MIWYKIQAFVHRLFHRLRIPICDGWEGPCFRLGKRRRLCTMYVDEEQNWTHQCQECYDGTNQHYYDLMSDIY